MLSVTRSLNGKILKSRDYCLDLFKFKQFACRQRPLGPCDIINPFSADLESLMLTRVGPLFCVKRAHAALKVRLF